jgi:hypothetical protein
MMPSTRTPFQAVLRRLQIQRVGFDDLSGVQIKAHSDEDIIHFSICRQ